MRPVAPTTSTARSASQVAVEKTKANKKMSCFFIIIMADVLARDLLQEIHDLLSPVNPPKKWKRAAPNQGAPKPKPKPKPKKTPKTKDMKNLHSPPPPSLPDFPGCALLEGCAAV